MPRAEKVELTTEFYDTDITIHADVYVLPPEQDVGINSFYVDDWAITKIEGSDATPAQLQNWLNQSAERREHFESRLLEAAGY